VKVEEVSPEEEYGSSPAELWVETVKDGPGCEKCTGCERCEKHKWVHGRWFDRG
jgi:hypothetical protein